MELYKFYVTVFFYICISGSVQCLLYICFFFIFIVDFLGRVNTFPYPKEQENEKLVPPEVTENEEDPPPHFLIEQTDLPPQARPPGHLFPLAVVNPHPLLTGTVPCQSEVDIPPTRHSVAHLLSPVP